MEDTKQTGPFYWVPYWGADDPRVPIIKSDVRPQIHEKVVALRKEVGGLKAKKKDGVAFMVKSASELLLKVRAAADELGLVIQPKIRSAKSLDVAKGTGADVVMTARVCAEDGSFIDFDGYGQGADSQDKAGGKAVTYSWKAALIYGLLLPDKEMVDTDDDSEPGGKEGNRARPIERGKNVTAPSEATEVERELAKAIDAIPGGDEYAAVLVQLRAAIDNRDVSKEQGTRLSIRMRNKKTALGLA